MSAEIHKSSEVQSIYIGDDTKIWQFCVILENAIIGSCCNINSYVFIENDVQIGNDVTIKSGVQVWDGLRIGNNVFVGPNVTFANDKSPRSKEPPEAFLKTIIRDFSSIGAGATILPGIELGSYCMIGAGSVVTKNVPPKAIFIGNPARLAGWVNEDGTKMKQTKRNTYLDNSNQEWEVYDQNLRKI